MKNTKTTAAFTEVCISPAHSGFGMFQRGESNGTAWADCSDLEAEISSAGLNFLPINEALADSEFISAGIEDISGKIYGGDPDHIYARIDDGPNGEKTVGYFGIDEIEVDEDYWDDGYK